MRFLVVTGDTCCRLDFEGEREKTPGKCLQIKQVQLPDARAGDTGEPSFVQAGKKHRLASRMPVSRLGSYPQRSKIPIKCYRFHEC